MDATLPDFEVKGKGGFVAEDGLAVYYSKQSTLSQNQGVSCP